MPACNQSTELDRETAMKAVNRCVEAYLHIMEQIPSGADRRTSEPYQTRAREAFFRHLPVLLDRSDFQIYTACIQQGVHIGVIHLDDAGRYLNMVSIAMQTWKLAHFEELKAAHPPLPKGNQHDDYESQQVRAQLPDRKTQDFYYKELRRRGLPVPNEPMLRNNPNAAACFCELYEKHRDRFPPPERAFTPQPAAKPAEEWLSPPHQAETAA